MVVCFVPGCKSGNRNKETTHMFKISKNASDEVRNCWKLNIPKQQMREFNFSSSYICHKHFEEEYLVKKNYVKLGSKVMSEENRQRWKLTDDAIPTLFSCSTVPKYFDKKVKFRPPPKVRREISAKKFKTKEAQLTVSKASLDFNYIRDEVNRLDLPEFWSYRKKENSIQFCKLVEDSRTGLVTFHSERTVEFFSDSKLTVKIRDKVLNVQESVYSLNELALVIKKVEEMIVCKGIENFNMLQNTDGLRRCGNSWISANCKQIMDELGSCEACVNARIIIQKRVETDLRQIRSVTLQRSPNLQRKHRLVRQTVRRMKGRVSRLNTSLKIMQRKFLNLETTTLESAINNNDNLSPTMKLTLLTSAHVAKSKSKHGVRYQSDWILQSLLLKICSPKAYRYLRENNLLPLPHPKHLTRLLRGLPCEFGFNKFIFEQLQKEFSGKPRKDRQFMLLFDEMKIREAISFDRTKMKFHGFIDYDEFTNDKKGKRSSKMEADHALVFMCRSLNSKLTQPIGCFATRGSAPGHILAKMIISCIIRLEGVGCEVVGVISDGATTNKSAWKILGLSGDADLISNKILNPVDETRHIHFLCDIPHVVKCIRNNLNKVGNAKFSGKNISWSFYKALYDVDKCNDLRTVPKLSSQHVNPNPFQKMVVSYATQIFSKSVARGIQYYREVQKHPLFKESEATEVFTMAINDLFDACNARLPSEGVRKESKSYQVIRDFLTGVSDQDTFASPVTLASVRVTLQSILDLTDYLCGVIGFDYVLTAKFNQDCLEKFFGLLRSFGGDDAHPTVTSFLHLYRLLSISVPISKTLKGNIRANEECSVISYMNALKGLQISSSKEKTDLKNELEDTLLNKIYHENADVMCVSSQSGNCNNNCSSPLRSIVYDLCGYLAFKSSRFTDCLKCIHCLHDANPDEKDCAFTAIKDEGHLRYPSKSLFRLIVDIVEPQISVVLGSDESRRSPTLVYDIISNLDNINCAGCSIDHSYPLIINVVLYYITIRMYFYSKNYNKECLQSTTETKKKMKEAKLQ